MSLFVPNVYLKITVRGTFSKDTNQIAHRENNVRVHTMFVYNNRYKYKINTSISSKLLTE